MTTKIKKNKNVQKHCFLSPEVAQKFDELANEKNLSYGGVVGYLIASYEDNHINQTHYLRMTIDMAVEEKLKQLGIIPSLSNTK